MVRHGCQVDVATDPHPLRPIHVNAREYATREIAPMQTVSDPKASMRAGRGGNSLDHDHVGAFDLTRSEGVVWIPLVVDRQHRQSEL
jgi:hypothetical protein